MNAQRPVSQFPVSGVLCKDGSTISCEPAFARLAALAAEFHAREIVIDYLGVAR